MIQIGLSAWYCAGCQVKRCRPDSVWFQSTLRSAKSVSEVDICW